MSARHRLGIPAILLAGSLALLTGCGEEQETPGKTTAEEGFQDQPPTQQPPEQAEAEAVPPEDVATAPAEEPGAAGGAGAGGQAALQQEQAPAETTAQAPGTEGATGAQPPAAGTADIAAAEADVEAAMQGAGCLACHGVDKKIIGPAYSWVAFRYQDDPNAADTLVQSIKQGSQGKWTDVTGGAPMPPNPQVSDEQARQFAQWILDQEPQEPPQ